MQCSDQEFFAFRNRWWVEADAENREGDPTLWHDWDKARWEFIRQICRDQHQGHYPELPEKPKSSGPAAAFVETELRFIITLREAVRNRIRARLSRNVAPRPVPPRPTLVPMATPKGATQIPLLEPDKQSADAGSAIGQEDIERAQIDGADPTVQLAMIEGARIARRDIAECDKQSTDLGLAWGPEAVKHAPIDVTAPIMQLALLQGTRFARRDIIDGFIVPEREYGLDRPTALAHCDVIEAEARLAVLGWTNEPLRKQDQEAIRAWQKKLMQESQAASGTVSGPNSSDLAS